MRVEFGLEKMVMMVDDITFNIFLRITGFSTLYAKFYG